MFSVRIEPHGREIQVRADQNVLDAALAAGINLPHSCKSGHCSSCRATLRRGEFRYPRGQPAGLTSAESAAGRMLLCQAQPRSDLIVEVRVIARAPEVDIKTLPCRILQKTALAPDVQQVLLRLPAVESLDFRPGQYLDVLLDDGRRRSFSIASPPHDSRPLELHVRRAPGGQFTTKLFDEFGPGSLLRIEGPIGQFAYRSVALPLLLVAGGTGFAPIKSILRHVLEAGEGADRERLVHLFWGGRQAVDLYEDSVLRGWASAHPRFRYTGVLSEARTVSAAHHRLGWVHEAVLNEYGELPRCEAWVAGPPGLIEAARIAFTAAGLPEDRLRFDSFDYAPA